MPRELVLYSIIMPEMGCWNLICLTFASQLYEVSLET